LIASEYRGLPFEQLGKNLPPLLRLRLLMFLKDSVVEANHMLAFVVFEEL
jgi:hypothetical protein